MRLTEFEINSIKLLAKKHFGEGVRVFLFGSRVSDEKRGGDIDLFVSNNDYKNLTTRAKIDFLTDLVFKIGEQKIDVVMDNPRKKDSQFFKSINQSSIQLC